MKLSAKNQIKGTIKSINKGAVNGIVAIAFGKDQCITATISLAAIEELELQEGKEAYAVIKATEVMIGLGDLKLSARNKFSGEITEINQGAVNAIVKLRLESGDIISSTISLAAVKELGLETGKQAVAVIKATSVMLGI